jgi:hypothetical protein
MPENNSEAVDDFDILDALALKADDEIEMVASSQVFSMIERIEEQLVTRPMGRVDQGNLVSRVRALRELKRSGSRALGDAILEASSHVDHEDIPRAREVYEKFLSNCDSPFYRRIAELQLRKLSG